MQDCTSVPTDGKTRIAHEFPTSLQEWRDFYAGGVSPREVLHALLAEIRAVSDPAWIALISDDELDTQLSTLADGPLHGVPFAVKDNIDAARMPTTAACPEFAYMPECDATAVAILKQAGAVLLGKTNLDQFATGLVGTRSPYGAVPNTFDPERISGGSSSGSASVVARGIVPFSLGTDTAGSGRIPAGLNNLVGLKPSRGSISTSGVVPACRTLDCVSIFALSVEDALEVHGLLRTEDPGDAYSRVADPVLLHHRFGENPCFAVPSDIDWHGDTIAEAAYQRALEQLNAMGAEIREIDFTPMAEMAELLYGGPWVAERLAAIREFMMSQPDSVHPVVAGIISQGDHYDAVDVYRAEYRRATLAKKISAIFKECDALLVPTAPIFPTIEEVNAAPVVLNSRLGAYTNFVNLSDCCALALPAGFRDDGLPFGLTWIAPAWHDDALADFGMRWQNHWPWLMGATGQQLPKTVTKSEDLPSCHVRLAVVGAHLSGMPLNHQLTDRKARFIAKTTTSPQYRLFALPGTIPPKPGLIRHPDGASIEVEIWDVPVTLFGSFVAGVPAPLGIGSLELEDGTWVKGFICEGWVTANSRDITSYGGWRAFMANGKI